MITSSKLFIILSLSFWFIGLVSIGLSSIDANKKNDTNKEINADKNSESRSLEPNVQPLVNESLEVVDNKQDADEVTFEEDLQEPNKVNKSMNNAYS